MDRLWASDCTPLQQHMPAGAEARVAAIYRKDATIIPDGGTVIEENDIVFFLAARRDIPIMMKELRPQGSPVRRIILAGGGNIGSNLAAMLERRHHVKVIERDPERAELIAEDLEKAIVLVGDCSDEDLLREEAIETTDVYCVLTNDDETNILSSMLAKKMGAGKVIALINRPSLCRLGGRIWLNRHCCVTPASNDWRAVDPYTTRQYGAGAFFTPWRGGGH